MKDRIGKLRQLTDMVKDVELAKLRKLQDARLRIEQQRADLRNAQAKVRSSVTFDPAHLVGMDEKWRAWAEDRLRVLSVQDARAAAEVEVQKSIARQAFGRDQAVLGLAKKLT